jgi:hypothetical protein
MNKVIEPRMPGTITGISIFEEFSDNPPKTASTRKEIDRITEPWIRSHASVIRKK